MRRIAILALVLAAATAGCLSTGGTAGDGDLHGSDATDAALTRADIGGTALGSSLDSGYSYETDAGVPSIFDADAVTGTNRSVLTVSSFEDIESRPTIIATGIYRFNSTAAAEREYGELQDDISYDVAELVTAEYTDDGFVEEVEVTSGNRIVTVYRRSRNVIYTATVGHFEGFRRQEAMELADAVAQKMDAD